MVRALVLGAFTITVGIMLPRFFHMFGAAGSIFLPMHIPVMLAGLLLGPRFGLIVGILTPLLSSLLTGMPPLMPILPIMLPELAAYGWCGGYLYRLRRHGLLFSLLLTMLLGRIMAMLGAFLLVRTMAVQLAPLYYLSGAVLTGLPGIILQIILLPVLVKQSQQYFRFSTKDLD